MTTNEPDPMVAAVHQYSRAMKRHYAVMAALISAPQDHPELWPPEIIVHMENHGLDIVQLLMRARFAEQITPYR